MWTKLQLSRTAAGGYASCLEAQRRGSGTSRPVFGFAFFVCRSGVQRSVTFVAESSRGKLHRFSRLLRRTRFPATSVFSAPCSRVVVVRLARQLHPSKWHVGAL